jgi:XTP/dITP diphosphohydrolase
MRVVLATSNAGKFREAQAILADSGIEIVSLPLWLGDVETGTTYAENARLKAEAAMRMVRMPVMAEDAGLEVDALAGLPGPRSARFAGFGASDADNTAKLLRLLEGVAPERRTARYRAVVVLLMADGSQLVAEGVFEGSISDEPRGTDGFGYDPVFVPKGEVRTAAELTPDEKNTISHRGVALRGLAAQVP